jgi:hypothetical protein
MERRQFILASGGLLSCAGLHSVPALAAATQLMPADALRRAGYAALLNQNFNVYANNRGIGMRLVTVRDRRSRDGREQFTLVFAAPEGTTLASGTYDVEYGSSGPKQMYLELAGSSAQGVLYRADFSLVS